MLEKRSIFLPADHHRLFKHLACLDENYNEILLLKGDQADALEVITRRLEILQKCHVKTFVI